RICCSGPFLGGQTIFCHLAAQKMVLQRQRPVSLIYWRLGGLGGMLSRAPRDDGIRANPTAKAWDRRQIVPVLGRFACFWRGSRLYLDSARVRQKHATHATRRLGRPLAFFSHSSTHLAVRAGCLK